MRALLVHNRYSSRVPSGENAVVDDEARWLRAQGVEVARLGKRVYRDELSLVQSEGARRRYRMYGEAPDHVKDDGTDLAAVAAGRIAVTPLHFDLTDQPGIETLGRYDLARLLAPASEEIDG